MRPARFLPEEQGREDGNNKRVCAEKDSRRGCRRKFETQLQEVHGEHRIQKAEHQQAKEVFLRQLHIVLFHVRQSEGKEYQAAQKKPESIHKHRRGRACQSVPHNFVGAKEKDR